jgi:hypothetical protein
LRLPDSLHEGMKELAKQDGISINQFATIAIAEKLAVMMAGDYLQARAAHANRPKFEEALRKVPAADPSPGDTLN